MRLQTLKESLKEFLKAIDQGWESGLEPLYDTIGSWQNHWPPSSSKALADTIDLALVNDKTRRYWQGHAYFPKETIILLAQQDPELIFLAFSRLFDQELELAERFRSFNNYLDEALAEYGEKISKKAPSIHYHQDYRAPSLYCLCRYPLDHAYFEHNVYRNALLFLTAKNVDAVRDPNRFFKSTKVVLTFLKKEEQAANILKSRMSAAQQSEIPALVASEYFRYINF